MKDKTFRKIVMDAGINPRSRGYLKKMKRGYKWHKEKGVFDTKLSYRDISFVIKPDGSLEALSL